MRVAMLILAVLLAGCLDEGGHKDVVYDGVECDYELDDYAGGTPHVMVHWDIDGDRAMSGIPFNVQLLRGESVVAGTETTTDCALFHMENMDSDHAVVREVTDAACYLEGSMDYAFTGTFDTVRIEVATLCSH